MKKRGKKETPKHTDKQNKTKQNKQQTEHTKEGEGK